ncbi:MAG: OmpA family protein, partial [Lewinella sp.]
MRQLFTLLVALACTSFLIAQTESIELTASVYFASASHLPDEAALDKLNAFADQLNSYADYTLKLEAYTDEQGTDDYNAALARRRADAIAKALAFRTVIATSTEVLTFGEQRASINTTDDAERQKDRRVDLVATVVRWTDADAALAAARLGQKQIISIEDPTELQTVKGDKGGVFIIDGNSLVLEDGTPVSGPVSIQLEEAYELSDMLLAGLSTTSDGRHLETGGMFNLTATDEQGRPLKLKTGRSIAASIPTDYYNEDMKLFTGTDHAADGTPTNWKLTDRGVRRSPEALIPPPGTQSTYEEYRERIKSIINRLGENYRLRCGGYDMIPELNTPAGRQYFSWLYRNPTPDSPNYVNPATYRLRKRPVLPDTNTLVYEPRGMDKVLMSKKKKDILTRQRRARVLKTFERQEARYQKAVAYRDNLPAVNEKKRLEFEAKMTEWEEGLERQKRIALQQVSRESFALVEARRLAYEKYRNMKIQVLEDNLATSSDLSGSEYGIDRYFLSVGNLGWANCDRFIGGLLDRVVVRANLEGSTPQAKVMLLPKGERSLIAFRHKNDGEWKNKGIPLGLSYHVIAYQVIDGQMVMA